MAGFSDFLEDKHPSQANSGGGFSAFLGSGTQGAGIAPKAGEPMLASHTPGEVIKPKPEGALKAFGRQALTGIGGGVGGVLGGVAATPETLGIGTVPGAIGGAAIGASLGKAAGNLFFGEKPAEVKLPTSPKGKNITESMGVGLKQLPQTLPRSAENILTMPHDIAKSIVTPTLQGNPMGSVKATGEAVKGLVEFPAQATGISDIYRNVTTGKPAFSDMSNLQTMIEEDPAGLVLGLEMGGKGIKAAKSLPKAIKGAKNAVLPGTHYEREAGKFFLEQEPKEGSFLSKEAGSNKEKAKTLQDTTGAKLSLEQQTGLNTQIGAKKALESRDPQTQAQAQDLREENLKLVKQMIKDVGGKEGDITDVRQALKDALETRREQVRMAENDLAESEKKLASGIDTKKIEKQKNVEDLYNQQAHLEDAVQRADEAYKNQQAERQQTLDRAKQVGDEQGKELSAGAGAKEEIGASARQKAELAKSKMKEEADQKYDEVRQYHDVEVPDHSPLEEAVRTVAAEHPSAFKELRDKADNVTKDVLKRIAPEPGEEAPVSPILDAQGKPIPIEAEGKKPLTIGELDALSKGVSAMRRSAAANPQTADLARRLGIIKDGINKSLETVSDEGVKGKFSEENTMSQGEWAAEAEAMKQNQFFSRHKKGKKGVTTASDFTAYMKDNYPTAAALGYEKAAVLGAVDKASQNNFKGMTDAERSIIDGMNRDLKQSGAERKGVQLDKSPVELIKDANKFYREEYVPKWRDENSPGAKILQSNKAGMDKVQDAEVMGKFLESGDKGINSGKMYREIYGEDTEPAHDYAVRDLLDSAFDENKGEWSPSSARGWLKKKSYALKAIGIYDDVAEVVNSIPDMAEMKKEIGEPSSKEKEAAQRDLQNFKARIGNVSAAVGKVDESALPEYGEVEDAKRVLKARQESLKALEKSPVGDMVTGDWESTMKNFVSAAKGDYADSVKLVMNTLKGNEAAQDAFKSAFAEHLYSKWLADAQKTMDLEQSPTPAKANRALTEFAPALKELYGEEGFKKVQQAKEILDSMARSQKNTVAGSETRLFGNSGRYRNMNRAISMLAVMRVPGTNWAVGTWLGSKMTSVMQAKFDGVLRRAYFDPAYADKLIDIAKKSETGPLKRTVRVLGKLLKDERGMVGLNINASGESSASMEAMNVEKSRANQGIKMKIIDSRSGRSRPAIGPRPEDNSLNPYDVLIQENNGKRIVVNKGAKAIDRGGYI